MSNVDDDSSKTSVLWDICLSCNGNFNYLPFNYIFSFIFQLLCCNIPGLTATLGQVMSMLYYDRSSNRSSPSYLSTSTPDGQSEHARRLAIVGQCQMGLDTLPNHDFLEKKTVFLLNIHTFCTAERLRGELSAVTAYIMFFKN